MAAKRLLTADVTVTGDIAKTVAWTSSDEKIAAVDANGNVKAVAEGNATITATSTEDATKSASVAVTVTKKTTTEPEQPEQPSKPEQPAPAEKDLTDANHVDDPHHRRIHKAGCQADVERGQGIRRQDGERVRLLQRQGVLVASGVTVSKDGTVVAVTVPADLKLGATKFAVQFADDSLVWDAGQRGQAHRRTAQGRRNRQHRCRHPRRSSPHGPPSRRWRCPHHLAQASDPDPNGKKLSLTLSQ
ncbi:MAG: Ig domain-containing protein [Bifidobacterium bifidum]